MNKNKDLLTLQRVNKLCDDIYQALNNGDTDAANKVAAERLFLIQSINFEFLINECPTDAHTAIGEFEKTNALLISNSEEIKKTVWDELKKVKKSVSATKIYNQVSKQ